MTELPSHRLTGTATSPQAAHLFEELASHFVEHAQVHRAGNRVTLTNPLGVAEITHADDTLRFTLNGISPEALLMSRTVLAEHLFYFAGTAPLDLSWSDASLPQALPNLHMATLVSASMVTPAMRRLVFACADVRPFIGGDMHVRLLVPPTGRTPVWPKPRIDGRIDWPSGEDALLSRAYTIRSVDPIRNEVAIDIFQHPEPGIATPGADFARDAQPGTLVGLLGPGSGHLPVAETIFLAGDESALPAIARIIEELPHTSRVTALIEVHNAGEEQALQSQGQLDLRWIHRNTYAAETRFSDLVLAAITQQPDDAFIWVACEKADVRAVKSALRKSGRKPVGTYLAWYWAHNAADDSSDD
ncbi:MAG: DUF2218 domain-containing protein [Candidatus Devosia phytovorans]|uniref:DUF2218 domain-containing protein n=1 Tax=Candidatus Devosia phytovorans TaxID=3121372 RepID=A0AAJ5VTJ2_9HYPH|nr:DUF2218 domain-containing protein [Devosia sp.]WEK03660.1 MAG: DUF2218 domain-containing protein [Devosia sp.]